MLSLGMFLQGNVASAATEAGAPAPGLNTSLAPSKGLLLAQRSNRAGNPRTVKRLIKENNRRLKYTVEAFYPQLVGAASASAAGLNRELKELMTREVNDFKKNVAEQDADLPPEMQQSSFDAGYSIGYQSPDLISISFGISTYYAGAAHPNHHTLVLNYDLRAGRTLALSDLFNAGSGYMQAISAYTIKDLKKKLSPSPDTEWIERGAGPSSENYKSWTITPRGLSITFDPYQVASYAEGSHLVVIPYAALGNVINMNGPLGPLVKKGKR
jgi:hypothetical protein